MILMYFVTLLVLAVMVGLSLLLIGVGLVTLWSIESIAFILVGAIGSFLVVYHARLLYKEFVKEYNE